MVGVPIHKQSFQRLVHVRDQILVHRRAQKHQRCRIKDAGRERGSESQVKLK